MTVLIPQSEFEARVACAADAVMQRLPRRSEILQLLRAYLRSLEKTGFNGSAEARATIRRHIIDLAALALTPHGAIGESRSSAVATARTRAALDHIAARFREPEFSPAEVARGLGISPRYLQRLLEASGTSFTERVNELRLQRAFTLLTAAADGPRRISDIALDVGFSDISYFNRLFRSRFGDTPNGVRAHGRRAQ
jgi:AraC-like DNA-binding protein